ncbi:MAG: DUF4129 domain-containing protein [Bifidobacteriaceae bacterium]|nr:DUF4129 domain-containing protein [Bifidobacteriaceae bacterium]
MISNLISNLPVEPSADQARQLLRQELENSQYHRGPTLLQQVLQWLDNLFAGGMQTAPPRVVAIIIFVSLLVIVLVVLFSRLLKRRAAGNQKTSRAVLSSNQPATAAKARRLADKCAAAGDLRGACLARFQAIVLTLLERQIINPPAGATAQEITEQALRNLAEPLDGLSAAASLFDALAYGDLAAQASDYDQFITLDQAALLSTAHPPTVVDQTETVVL